MKLNLSKPRAFFAAKRDAAKTETLSRKLNEVSAVRRAEELQTPGLKRQEPLAPQVKSNQLKVKITQKGKANLMLNSGQTSALALPSANALRWKARRMTGRHLPGLQCNSCSISRVCPKNKPGYECAYTPFLNSHKVETAQDLVEYMKLMAGNSMKRAQLMSIFESASGGAPTVETSEALDLAFKQLKELHGVMTETGEQTVEIEGDATLVGSIFGGMKLEKLVEETADMHSNDPVHLGIESGAIPIAAGDVRAAQPDDVVEELIKDAVLGQTHELMVQDKKGSTKKPVAEIQQGDLS